MTVKSLIVLLSFLPIITSCNIVSKDSELNVENTYIGYGTEGLYHNSSDINKDNIMSKECVSKTSETPIKYTYQLPEECQNIHWYSDDIIQKIEFNDFTPSCYSFQSFDIQGYKEKLNQEFYQHFPKQIIDDLYKSIFSTVDENDEITTSKIGKKNSIITTIGSMMYDINSDGNEDYIIRAWVSENGSKEQFGFYIYKIYLKLDENNYKSISWDRPDFSPDSYLLKTFTNGLNDLMILSFGDDLAIKYDGKKKYSNKDYTGEKHYFINHETEYNRLIKINFKTTIEYPDNNYILMKFNDNPYLKENILYCNKPDGSPIIITDKTWSETVNFYAVLKEGVTIPDGYHFDPIEIRCITAR